MTTLAESLVSSTSRKLTLRIRPDLTARRQRYHGETYWVVKEPIGLNYYRFHEEEFAILQMLDGQTTLDEIKEEFEAEFAPQKITFQDLQQFIGMLHRSGLVVSDSSGQGRQLKKRRDEKKRRELLGKLSNVFAVRWRGLDPERFLTWLYQYTWWLFHPLCVALCLSICLCALFLVSVQFEVFRSRLPTFHQFFGPHNWIYLGMTMAVVKVLHEFGHGLSCKHFGGECHEMGFMLLVFTPCLYCNVSDSWMLPNKWHRVVIGAGGMCVEVVLASIATFLWWYSEPGLLNHLALSVMFICSVSTLIFNGNPLLRFDGYYILMDIAEIPNLRQKSTEVLKRFMVDLCLGLEQPENPFLPQGNRFFFGMYTVAAVIYRWVVVLSICMFLNRVLEPYGLKILGQAVAFAGFFGLIVQPIYRLGQFFYLPGRMHKVKRHRLIASIAVVGAIVAAIVYVPLPYAIKCSFEVSPRDAAAVYVDVPGRVEEIQVEDDETVESGQPLIRLSNPDLELAVLQLEGKLEQTRTKIRSVEQQRFRDDRASLQLDQLREVEATVEYQLQEKKRDLDRLNIVAPVAGTIIPVPSRQPRGQREGRLPTWSGSPLDRKNLGATFMESDLICRIGDSQHLEALLVVDQADIDLLDQAMRDGREPQAALQLDAFPGTPLEGKVIEVAKVELKAAPTRLSSQAGGQLNTKMDMETGIQRPLSTSYQARVPLVYKETEDQEADDQETLEGRVCTGMRGRAKIYVQWQSMGARLYRYVARTFHFEL